MKKELAYCECCDKDVDFEVKEITRKATIRGVSFETSYFRAVCKKCGTIVYPVQLEKKNDIALYDGYKKAVGLLTSSEIINIRKKHHLSQVALARIIGCGEKNIARYENGAIQDKVFDKFMRLIDDDEAYRIILKLNEPVMENKNQSGPKYCLAK